MKNFKFTYDKNDKELIEAVNKLKKEYELSSLSKLIKHAIDNIKAEKKEFTNLSMQLENERYNRIEKMAKQTGKNKIELITEYIKSKGAA